jgi:bifunctional enzyme CysN/CysC
MTVVQKLGDAGQGERGKSMLRFLTCGSVDDGKSTLIGRLLFDTKVIFEDQLNALISDSRRFGTVEGDIDFALLVDGLEAEREQGITIDVAYRFFTTPRRSFIVADTPGHEQFTRNMATGASHCDVAVILIDSRKGILNQTRRHSLICSLLGIRHVVLAINKIDLIDFSQAVFEQIVAEYLPFAAQLDFRTIIPIPISARFGDNVTARSQRTPWYSGKTLLEVVEEIEINEDRDDKPFRFPVQWVNRPNLDFRGYAGTVASGIVRVGDPIVVAASGAISNVARIVTADGDIVEARAGDAVTLTLSDEIDVARGDLIVPPTHRPEVADQIAAHLIWMSEVPLLPGRSYYMRIGNNWTPASVTAIKHKLDLHALEPLAARKLELNDIGVCNLSMTKAAAFDPYRDNRTTGSFLLVDRNDNQTLAAGLILFGLRRAANVHRERLAIDKMARSKLKGQRSCIVWFTGLPGSGKSTIARIVEARLHASGHHTYMLDGDNLRHGLNRDLGFTDADRVENVRRVGEVAKLFVDAGLIVLCAFVSPFRAERELVRSLVEPDEFLEVFVDTPLQECMRRDPKGLYAKALSGGIKNFTGIDSPYEAPSAPEIVLSTGDTTADKLAETVLEHLHRTLDIN